MEIEIVPKWYTRTEAAKILRISLSTLNRLIKAKNSPFHVKRIGRRVLIPFKDIYCATTESQASLSSPNYHFESLGCAGDKTLEFWRSIFKRDTQ